MSSGEQGQPAEAGPHLSKSRYLAGLQCSRRLWLDTHAPETAPPVGEARRFFFEMGEEVGRAAHALFPGGILVEEGIEEGRVDAKVKGVVGAPSGGAVVRTRELMRDASVPAIFEAAFESDDVRVRVDILERLEDGGWGLREVKSSSRVKPEAHLPDLEIQKWVVERNGIDVRSAQLIHVNKNFVARPEPLDASLFFVRAEQLEALSLQDLGSDDTADTSEPSEPSEPTEAEEGTTPNTDARGDVMAGRVAEMHAVLALDSAPLRTPGPFCKKPHACHYWDICTAPLAIEWKLEQRRASVAKRAQWLAATESGEVWFSDALPAMLSKAAPPVWILDFEAIAPAIPLYLGTRPYQAITFQWSLHHLDASGRSQHFEFLAEGREDPRPHVARALVERLRDDDRPILVYSNYERDCLKDLAECCPEWAEDLSSIRARLFDLLPVVRAHFYHPDLMGSFSLKAVGPVLAPSVDYTNLAGVADGAAAMGAFARIATGALSAEEEAALRRELLVYCRLDTEALMETYRGLRAGADDRG